MLKKVKFNVFYKYLFSYLLIFSIPFIVLSYVIYNNAVIHLQEEIEASNIYKLKQAQSLTDMRMKELQDIAVRMSFDKRLTPFMVHSNGYYEGEAIEELNKYKANSAIIEEVFLYFRGDEIIFSSTGMSSINTLIQDHLIGINKSELMDDLNSINIPKLQLIEDVQDNNKISYMVPIAQNSEFHYGTVMFLIEESLLTNLIEDMLGDLQGSVYVFDKKNQLLASQDKNSPIDLLEQIRTLIQPSQAAGIHSLRFDSEEYSVMLTQSAQSSWTFAIAMPTNQFLGKVAEVKTFILYILLFMVFVGVGTSLLLSVRQYRPIKELFYHLSKRSDQDSEEKQHNDWNQIRDTIDEVYDKQEDLLNQLELNRPLIRERFLSELLKGNFQQKEEIDTLISLHDIRFTGNHFFAIYISLEKDLPKAKHQMDLMQHLSTISVEHGSGYGVELIGDHAITLIMNLIPNQQIKQYQEDMVSEVFQFLKSEFMISPIIGVGKVYTDINQINRSFIEASAAIEYKLISGQNKIIYFEDIKDLKEQSIWYPLEEQVKLIQSLKQGDVIVASETLNEIMKSITSKEQSILLLKCMCFDVINSIFKTVTQMNMNEFSTEIKHLLEFSTTEELEQKMQRLILRICNKVKELATNKNTKLNDEIIQYIHQHFKSYEFSLESTSEHFEIALSSLSKCIKEITGVKFTDYVAGLRMDEVKKELINTDKPIREIISHVGYSDVPSFIRKFKKAEGITPGQFRKLYKDEH